MLFSSALFVSGFLPVVLGVNFALPRGLRNAWLLLASLVFHAWGEPVVALVMLASIATNYVLGLLVSHARSARGTRGVLIAAVAFNLGASLTFLVWGAAGRLAARDRWRAQPSRRGGPSARGARASPDLGRTGGGRARLDSVAAARAPSRGECGAKVAPGSPSCSSPAASSRSCS